MGKLTPKRCPNCGSTNIHNQELESPYDTSELYDLFCRDCKWSGDISPDLPLENASAPPEEEEPKTQKEEAEDEREWIPLEEVLKKHGAKKRLSHHPTSDPPKNKNKTTTQTGWQKIQ